MGAAVAGSAGLHGFPPVLTSFVGRAGAIDHVARLLGEYRLVTLAGPGGVGKTRLATEVARRVAGQFADGAWLVELAAVSRPARVVAAVAAALGVPERPGVPVADVLVEVLGRQQLLVVLDNCEHVAGAAAGLCADLLAAADDVRVLATSREPLRVAGEARYRLVPLTVPVVGDAGAASEAVALFADRARRADPEFAMGGEAGPAVGRLVARLDGMPLAIELAAARVEALGVGQLLDRLDDRFALLVAGDRLAAPRHRSLAATVEWSYRLLDEQERRVFRGMSVFPAPFTLEAAEAVGGAGAGPVVVRLVECSLLAPPRPGPDGRARYLMLETLRAYAAARLAETGEQPQTAAALARYAVQVTEQAAAQMQTAGGELDAARWLDAEDATVHQALAWALDHDPAVAQRLATALASWWLLRGRFVAGYALLRAAAAHAAPGSSLWQATQYWLSQLAYESGDYAGALGYLTGLHDAMAAELSPVLVDTLTARSAVLMIIERAPEGIEDARRAVALARGIGYKGGEALALAELSIGAYYASELDDALAYARQAQRIDPARTGRHDWAAGAPAAGTGRPPSRIVRRCNESLMLALLETGDLASAWQCCTDGLVQARQAGDLHGQAQCLSAMADLDQLAGRIPEAGAHQRESLQIATRTGDPRDLLNCLETCGHLCAATGRWAEALTVWAAVIALSRENGIIDPPQDAHRRQAPSRKARQLLGAARARAAEQRGTAMTAATAGEFSTMLAAPALTPGPGPGPLSPRERELVTLVARGRTDAQIAAQLYISVRTVRSHLDRIRDKTGCRRRADLTRLALQAGLI